MSAALTFLTISIAIGFSVAAPVGPIAVLCMQRTVARGKVSGFITGLGAATADGLYGAIAAFGLTALSGFLLEQKLALSTIGGLFLLYLGVRTFISPAAAQAAVGEYRGLFSDYASTFFLTLTNPMTILSFIAVFSGFGLVEAPASMFASIAATLGIMLGSAFWWLALSGVVGAFKNKIRPMFFTWINRLSGVVIFGFGAAILFSAI